VSARVADSVAAMEAPVLAREYPAPATPVQRKIQASLHNPGSTFGSDEGNSLDHVLLFHETSLRRILRSYLDYYHRSRTHLSLGKDSPEPRSIQPEQMGRVVALPQVGGLHHRYERQAA
jgi:hypothetical protein